MKTILSVLLLAFALNTARAADEHFAGAYYTTKAPIPEQKEAGALDVYFLDNSVCEIDVFYNGAYAFTAEGTYRLSGKVFKIAAVYESGSSIFFFGNYKSGLITGTFSIFGEYTAKGKFQATRVVSDSARSGIKSKLK